jgi:hypothetical protein
MRRDLASVREKLGPPGAVERAADIISGMLVNYGAMGQPDMTKHG